MRNMANNSILIVDDEEDICYLLSGILKKKNYEPVFANSLSDALQAIDRSPPSLLILDNRLPDGLGIDFIPYVKEKYPSVKILMVTAYDSASDKLMAYSKGADFFIAKPLNRDLINLAIDQLL
jgi:two-component system OmpR family response regulator